MGQRASVLGVAQSGGPRAAMSALTQAHSHEARADAIAGNGPGELSQRLDARLAAARAFETAADETHDATARDMLQLMAAKQRQSAADDRRRLDKARAQPAPRIGARSQASALSQRLPRRDLYASTVASSFVSNGRRMPMDASRMTEGATPTSASTLMGESSVMPDGSFMVVRDVNDPRDPFHMIEGMLAQLSRPVAFASLPLPSKAATPQPSRPRPAPDPSPSPPPDLVDSFLFVPTASPSKSSAPSKTIEELTMENASLKASLDSITAQLHAINTERDQLRCSIADLGRGLRATPLTPQPPAAAPVSRPEDLQRIADLESELEAARASAVKHKTRYESLKDAIKRKRAAREAEAAAAAGSSPPAAHNGAV